MLGIAITMFVLATMHIGVNYARIIKAFVVFKDKPGGPGAFFNQLSEFTQIFGSTIYVAQTLVGDSVVACPWITLLYAKEILIETAYSYYGVTLFGGGSSQSSPSLYFYFSEAQ